MTSQLSARHTLEEILRGTRPSRPLFLPIAFSLGARIENVPLRAFLANPTKICNALSRIRGYIPSDGITCYFDLALEAEALGATLDWNSASELPTLHSPSLSVPGPTGPGLPRPEHVVQQGRIPIACEVIRRLKSTVTQDCLLVAGITGVITLASTLSSLSSDVGQASSLSSASGSKTHSARRDLDLASPIFEFAASLVTEISKRYVEAGADVILIVEPALPPLSPTQCEQWASLLAPASNIIRFYESLPVLLPGDRGWIAANYHLLMNDEWISLLCPAIAGSRTGLLPLGSESPLLGMAVPFEKLAPAEPDNETSLNWIQDTASTLRPVVITTSGDLPLAVDIKQAAKILANLRHSVLGPFTP
jgi:hypothetical protein